MNQDKTKIENVSLLDIASLYGTPCYVYSEEQIINNWQAYDQALHGIPHLICYAVKANSNLSILKILAELGSGFDIVSGGELARCLYVDVDPQKIVFSGVGKTQTEITDALKANIRCFNIESAAELSLVSQVAKNLKLKAPISIRINPNIDADTHPYIATGLAEHKFGVNLDEALQLYLQANTDENLEIIGIDCHIGSQITQLAPFNAAVEEVLAFKAKLEENNIQIKHLNLGGGLGINYNNENVLKISQLATSLKSSLSDIDVELILEPGRSIIGDAGVLLTQVLLTKQNSYKNFAIVDAAMTDCLRPALYQAYHPVYNLSDTNEESRNYDIVGPVCESGDFLAKDRELALEAGNILAIDKIGAYCAVMGSNYNSRQKAPEILVSGNRHQLIRKRQELTSLWEDEVT